MKNEASKPMKIFMGIVLSLLGVAVLGSIAWLGIPAIFNFFKDDWFLAFAILVMFFGIMIGCSAYWADRSDWFDIIVIGWAWTPYGLTTSRLFPRDKTAFFIVFLFLSTIAAYYLGKQSQIEKASRDSQGRDEP